MNTEENNNESAVKLSKDLKAAAATLGPQEVRYIVDSYYIMQDNRIRSSNQIRSMQGEPHMVLKWVLDQSDNLEKQIKGALNIYAKSQEIGQWSLNVCGIGPVITAGLMAHIDITQCPTVGHIWRYAGLDPTSAWYGRDASAKIVKEVCGSGKEKITKDQIAECAAKINRKVESLESMSTTKDNKLTRASLVKAMAKRPWNASLKCLCWKIGESFVKVSGNPKSQYGALYAERKAQEILKNEAGAFRATAEIKAKTVGKNTEAYKAYSEGKLPPAHIHARAKRYAVKLFLAHWHDAAYRFHFKTDPPKPYAIAILGHAHEIKHAD